MFSIGIGASISSLLESTLSLVLGNAIFWQTICSPTWVDPVKERAPTLGLLHRAFPTAGAPPREHVTTLITPERIEQPRLSSMSLDRLKGPLSHP